MSVLISSLAERYNEFQKVNKDPRVDGWFLMDSPSETLVLCAAYVLFSKVWGPKAMKGKNAYSLNGVMMLYNVMQVILNGWIFYITAVAFSTKFSFTCQPVGSGNSPEQMQHVRAVWWFYFSKLLDFADTVFLVLRKKNITYLHVIHHGTMPMSSWLGCKFAPGGHTMFIGLMNSFVHVLMYSYYFIAALGPAFRPYIWWKKYLTTVQLIQFVAVFTHNIQLLFRSCNYPMFLVHWFVFKSILYFILFANFYNKSYVKVKASHKEK